MLLILLPALLLAQDSGQRAPQSPPQNPPAQNAPQTPSQTPGQNPPPNAARPVPPPRPVYDPADDPKVIYAIGLSIYQSLSRLNLSPDELKTVQQAINDAAAGKPSEELKMWGPKISMFAQARAAQALAREKAESTAYLEKESKEAGAMKTDSGIIYRQITPGTGSSPKATDKVKVNYRGTLVSGAEFDSNKNGPAEFTLSGVIPCWTEGLQKMKVGEKAQLVCPSNLAYGDRGRPGIPGGSALTFQIELLEIEPSAPAPAPSATPGAPEKPATPPPPKSPPPPQQPQ